LEDYGLLGKPTKVVVIISCVGGVGWGGLPFDARPGEIDVEE
jgi:hypothetical protein